MIMKQKLNWIPIVVQIIFLIVAIILLPSTKTLEKYETEIHDLSNSLFYTHALLLKDELNTKFNAPKPEQFNEICAYIAEDLLVTKYQYKLEIAPTKKTLDPILISNYPDSNSSFYLINTFESPHKTHVQIFFWIKICLTFAIFATLIIIIQSFKAYKRLGKAIRQLTMGDFESEIQIEKSSIDAYAISLLLREAQKNLKAMFKKEKHAKQIEIKHDIELDIAREIQESFLASDFKEIEDQAQLSVYAELKESPQVGGDFYDVIKLDNAHIYLGLGDAAGTGIPATFSMIIAKTMMHNLITKYRDIGKAITTVNNEVSRQKFKEPISLFGCIINIHTGKIQWANGGEIKAWVYHSTDQSFDDLCTVPEIPGTMSTVIYNENKSELKSTDYVIALSNGFDHLVSPQGETLSEEKLQQMIRENIHPNGKTFVKQLFEAIQKFTHTTVCNDDLTLGFFHSDYIIKEYPKVVPDFADSITLPNELKALSQLTAWAEAFNDQKELPLMMSMPLALIQEEWFVNIVSYAYADKKEHEIIVSSWVQDGCYWLRFEDDGMPYDPTARKEVDTDVPLEQRGIGGLGIHFIKQTADIFAYQREKNKNIITIMKHIPPSTSEEL